MLVCSRLARAARSAAQVSGSSTSMAMMMPTTAFGAPHAATTRSMRGDSGLARPTTPTSDTSSSPKLGPGCVRRRRRGVARLSFAPPAGRK